VIGTAPTLRGSAYPPAWRAVAGLLRIISGASLPVLFVLLLTQDNPPLAPPLLLRLFLIWVATPFGAAWLIRRAFAVDLRVGPTALELTRRDVHVELPLDSIQRIIPWRIPLARPGVSLQLQSGRRFRWELALDDPTALLAELSGSVPAASASNAVHPVLVYAHAKAARPPRRLAHCLAKFPGFALLPAAILFYTHQSIAHGGPFGEYYTFGLGAYLTTFAVYWGTVAIYLVLYASVWRLLAETFCLLIAWRLPARARAVRVWAERTIALLYYGGVPVVLALRYLG
jgi:apolipoprotein N-acyltransferase